MQSAKWLSILLAFLLIIACQKEPVEPEFNLTPITQTGARTVSFRVDERIWQPYGRICFGSGGGACLEDPFMTYYNPKRGQFQISCFLSTKVRVEEFSLSCDSLFQIGSLVLPALGQQNRQFSGGLHFGSARQSGDPTYTTRDPTRTNIKITRLDTVARIISGEFNGYLQGDLNSTQAITISEGRFDVKY